MQDIASGESLVQQLSRFGSRTATAGRPNATQRTIMRCVGRCKPLTYARLVGNDATRQDVYRRYREILLPDQLAVDGSFSTRAGAEHKPYSYSIFNFG